MICAKSLFKFVYVGGHKIGLEFCNVDVERTIEAQGGCEGGDDLCQEPVQVCIRGTLNVQVATADVVQSFIVVHDGHVGVFKKRMDAEHGVVRLNNRSRHLGASPDGEAQLGLFAVINGEALQHQAAKSTSGPATNSIVDHEALQAGAIVCELPNAVQYQIHDLFPYSVVSTCEIVCRIFLAGDQLLWMEQLTICAGTHFIDHGRLQVHKDGARHVLAGTCLAEERVESIVATTNRLVTGHLAIWLDAMLKAEKLPAGIANLHTALTNVKTECLAHVYEGKEDGSSCRESGKETSGKEPKVKAGGLSSNVTDQVA